MTNNKKEVTKGHNIARCVCSVCLHTYIGILPVDLNDDKAIECTACGRRTVEAVAYVSAVACAACGQAPDGVFDDNDLTTTPCPECGEVALYEND